jgi:peptide/nickel transport system substrate-binding protein
MGQSKINGRNSRARVVRLVGGAVLLTALFVGIAAAGCGGGGGGTSASPSATTGPQPGGTLKIGMQAGNGQFDPVMMAGSVGDIILTCQVQENLVELAQDFSLKPRLAKEWSSTDGTTWKITLQDGVKFSNGQPFSADDVVYSLDRLRGKDSPMAGSLANVVSVVADDPTHVTVNLKTADAEFMALMTDYRAKMFCKSVKDPMKELVGTGAYILESYAAEDRAVLKANPDYWAKDANGNKLPYLDGIEFVYSPDTAGQIEGLQGGSLNWVGGLSSEQKQTVEANSNLKTITTATNYCYELQIRCDHGPGAKLAFRQALMAGTDRASIVNLVAPGVGQPGNGTLVGPVYKAYYSDQQVPYDPAKAKQLLAQAGYPNGVSIKLVAQTADPVPALATAWQAQMKQIGVNVSITQLPPDVYYTDKGTDTWFQADFSFVDWGTRAQPVTYFQLALTSDNPTNWNYSRWKDPQFDALVKQIPQELDQAKRADLYKQAQGILQEQVPMINFLINTAVAGESTNVDGIALNPDWAHTEFRTAYFTK